MESLFNPDAGINVPSFWQSNRMLILGGLVVALFFYYQSIWDAYKHLIRIYRDSVEISRKPAMSPLQASYHYQQDKTRCVLTWLIELCRQGALSLSYKKGVNPWSVRRVSVSGLNKHDQTLVEILFQEDNRVHLKASFSEPNPHVIKAADKLYKNIESENSHYFLVKKSSRPTWFLFSALIVEALFCTVRQGPDIPAVIIVTLMAAGFLGLVAFFSIYMLPSLLNGPRGTAIIAITGASVIALFAHMILFGASGLKVPYLTAAFYPSLVAVIGVLVKYSPLIPETSSSLSQIVGYKKYLGRNDHQVKEEDLPWTLGLGVHGDIMERSFHYAGQTAPEWIKSKEDDVQDLMKKLHQTLYRNVKEAIFGEIKSSSRLGGGDRGQKY